MKLTEVTDDSKCCCSCKHNIRSINVAWGCVCRCDKDGHYIGYIANFTEVCEEWETESQGNHNGE